MISGAYWLRLAGGIGGDEKRARIERHPEGAGQLLEGVHGGFEIDGVHAEADVAVDQVGVECGDQAELAGDLFIGAARGAAVIEIAQAGFGADAERAGSFWQRRQITGEGLLLFELLEAIARDGVAGIELKGGAQSGDGQVFAAGEEFAVGALGALLDDLEAGNFQANANGAVGGRKSRGLNIGE